MSQYATEQEQFWAGDFGNAYLVRNQSPELVAGNLALFSKILGAAGPIESVLEFGANIGLNMVALKQLLPKAQLSAIEINTTAAKALNALGVVKVYEQSIFDFIPDQKRTLTFTKGVLIHINPEMLPKVYDLLYQSSSRYICMAEYYNPTPVRVPYRGHEDVLFKRDFAGEIMDRFADLRLVDYGFSYHRDANFAQDDINWFLMEKTA